MPVGLRPDLAVQQVRGGRGGARCDRWIHSQIGEKRYPTAACPQQIQTSVDWLGKMVTVYIQEFALQSTHQGQGLQRTKGTQYLQVQHLLECANRVSRVRSLKGVKVIDTMNIIWCYMGHSVFLITGHTIKQDVIQTLASCLGLRVRLTLLIVRL